MNSGLSNPVLLDNCVTRLSRDCKSLRSGVQYFRPKFCQIISTKLLLDGEDNRSNSSGYTFSHVPGTAWIWRSGKIIRKACCAWFFDIWVSKLDYFFLSLLQHKAPDYSAVYVVIKTDRPDGLKGYGFTFTLGRGTELGKAIRQHSSSSSSPSFYHTYVRSLMSCKHLKKTFHKSWLEGSLTCWSQQGKINIDLLAIGQSQTSIHLNIMKWDWLND